MGMAPEDGRLVAVGMHPDGVCVVHVAKGVHCPGSCRAPSIQKMLNALERVIPQGALMLISNTSYSLDVRLPRIPTVACLGGRFHAVIHGQAPRLFRASTNVQLRTRTAAHVEDIRGLYTGHPGWGYGVWFQPWIEVGPRWQPFSRLRHLEASVCWTSMIFEYVPPSRAPVMFPCLETLIGDHVVCDSGHMPALQYVQGTLVAVGELQYHHHLDTRLTCTCQPGAGRPPDSLVGDRKSVHDVLGVLHRVPHPHKICHDCCKGFATLELAASCRGRHITRNK